MPIKHKSKAGSFDEKLKSKFMQKQDGKPEPKNYHKPEKNTPVDFWNYPLPDVVYSDKDDKAESGKLTVGYASSHHHPEVLADDFVPVYGGLEIEIYGEKFVVPKGAFYLLVKGNPFEGISVHLFDAYKNPLPANKHPTKMGTCEFCDEYKPTVVVTVLPHKPTMLMVHDEMAVEVRQYVVCLDCSTLLEDSLKKAKVKK